MFWANMSSSWLDFFDAAGISEDPNAQTMLDDLDDQGGSATGFTDTSHLPLDLDRSPACIMSQHLESGRTVQVLQASSRENPQGGWYLGPIQICNTFTEERKEVLNFIGLLLREFVNPRYPYDSILFPHFSSQATIGTNF